VKNIIIASSLLFLIGCGGGGGGGTSEEIVPQGTEKMAYGQLYTVTTGDQVVKTSEDTQIRVTHVIDEINSTIELVEGTANIIRKQ
jgi:hypothetical protein